MRRTVSTRWPSFLEGSVFITHFSMTSISVPASLNEPLLRHRMPPSSLFWSWSFQRILRTKKGGDITLMSVRDVFAPHRHVTIVCSATCHCRWKIGSNPHRPHLSISSLATYMYLCLPSTYLVRSYWQSPGAVLGQDHQAVWIQSSRHRKGSSGGYRA